MAWAGSFSIALVENDPTLALVSILGFDADGENLIDIETLSLADFHKIGILKGLIPREITWWLNSTHATTVVDVISLKLMASLRPLTETARWIELGEITDADEDNTSTTSGTSADVTEAAFPTQTFSQFDIDCITVGAGNTLNPLILVRFGK